MKKISVIMMSVLLCTQVFANGTDEPTGSSVAVTNSFGSSIYKLYYKADKSDDVMVSILDASGKIIISDKIKGTDGFVRPYNFSTRPEGEYTIEIKNSKGKHVEKVKHQAGKIEKAVHVLKLAGNGKYLLTVASKSADKINVNIYNGSNELIHTQERLVSNEFAEVINMKSISDFTIEISDSKGLVKSFKY